MNVPDLLQDLVRDEPAFVLDPADAIALGQRARQRRRAAYAGISVLVTGGVAATAVAVVALAPAAPTESVQVSAAAEPVQPAPPTPLEQAVRGATPAGWGFSDVVLKGDSLMADVDDGAGPTRLLVSLSKGPRGLQQHPCRDKEFALTSVCTETMQTNGSRLILRGPAPSGPVTSTMAVVVYADGSGVTVESDGATWAKDPFRSGDVVTEAEKRALASPLTIRDPAFTAEQLGKIAQAVDTVL